MNNTIDYLKYSKAKGGSKLEDDFYRFYLDEHQNIICRRLHFLGSSLGLISLTTAAIKKQPKYLLKGLLAGYACAWAGHLFFEKNKPATFKFPLRSFVSDYRMYKDIITGRLSLKSKRFDKIS